MEQATASVIALEPVESSKISALGHDPGNNVLAIQFKGKAGPGSIYHYSNFGPEQFAAFKNAESIGSHFGKVIKPFPDVYPYVKIS